MRRREFNGLVGGAAAWPLVAHAQQDGRVRRVGVLMANAETDQEAQARFAAFRQALADLGWVEGRNLRIDVRWAGTDGASLHKNASELVSLAPEAIMVTGSPATQALQTMTGTIPIVFVAIGDPVAVGIVSNLARPEGNVTGYMAYEFSLAGKWISLLRDMVPRLTRVAVLGSPVAGPTTPLWMRAAEEAGGRLGISATAALVRDDAAIEAAVSAMAQPNDGGLIILPVLFFVPRSASLIALAAKYRVPTIYYTRFWAAGGGLMSYGSDLRRQYRDGATYVDRILRGAKVADLPVQFATKFELVINLKTAKALDLDVRPDLLTLADEVIE